MLNQKKVEIFLAKFHKSLAKQFLEVAFKTMPLSTQNSHGYECKPLGLGYANHMLCSAEYGIYILASSNVSYINKGRNLRLRPLCGIVYSQLLFFFYYVF